MNLKEIEKHFGTVLTIQDLERIIKDIAKRYAPAETCQALSIHHNIGTPPYVMFHTVGACIHVEAFTDIQRELALHRANSSGLKLSFLDTTRTQKPNATT